MNQFSRLELLIGADGIEKLNKARILVFGVGGVGGYAVEALARSGIGTLDLVDDDVVNETNLNRQIIATISNLGRPKVEIFRERIADISPETIVNIYQGFYLPENKSSQEENCDAASEEKHIMSSEDFDFASYDYVVDAIDTVAAKLDIIEKCSELQVPIISAMGCGNKLDPTKLVVTDINKTEMDPLAKVIRKELRERGIKKLKVVYSTEQPIKPAESSEKTKKRTVPGSSPFVPPAAGLIIAAEVVKDLLSR